jgi:hypothetical protein
MKVVFVLFDSLNRHMLGPMAATRIPTPNFDRLARRSIIFRPPLCRLAALHAGAPRHADRRLSFLHRSGGRWSRSTTAFPEILCTRPASTAT